MAKSLTLVLEQTLFTGPTETHRSEGQPCSLEAVGAWPSLELAVEARQVMGTPDWLLAFRKVTRAFLGRPSGLIYPSPSPFSHLISPVTHCIQLPISQVKLAWCSAGRQTLEMRFKVCLQNACKQSERENEHTSQTSAENESESIAYSGKPHTRAREGMAIHAAKEGH